jgi:hypothetical protein
MGGKLSNSTTDFDHERKVSLPASTGASDVWDEAQSHKKFFQKIQIVQRLYHSTGCFQIENIFTDSL